MEQLYAQIKTGNECISFCATEKGLGLTVGHKMNMSQQYTLVARNANSTLNCINVKVACNSREVYHFSALLRPYLSIVSSFGSHISKKTWTNERLPLESNKND